MTEFQTNKVTDYLVSKILRDNIAKKVISSDNNISEIKARLIEEVTARLCVQTLDCITFNELVQAVEDQINISDYIN